MNCFGDLASASPSHEVHVITRAIHAAHGLLQSWFDSAFFKFVITGVNFIFSKHQIAHYQRQYRQSS